jgi:nitrile hydratase subunit beta
MDGVDGPHDLGGRDGFGAVVVEPDEPVFHEAWEGRVYAMTSAASRSGAFGTPEFRHAIERIPPASYLASSYYERWLRGLATLLLERGLVGREDLVCALGEDFEFSGPARVDSESSTDPTAAEQSTFPEGQLVQVRNMHPHGHTRCPGYVRGRRGVIVRSRGPVNFDDAEAATGEVRTQPVHCVAFDAFELWGHGAEGHTTVLVDLFESYLEAR